MLPPQIVRPDYLWVVVGEHDLSTTGETDRTRSYAVDRVQVHTTTSQETRAFNQPSQSFTITGLWLKTPTQ